MIAGLDSSFSRPTPAQIAQAWQAGVRVWGGYLATRSGVNLASPWDKPSFDVVRTLGSRPIAFCSGWDDPVACRNLAVWWDVSLCLDVEDRIRPDGSWVQQWLDLSGAGLYGQHYQDTSGTWHSVHLGRNAAFHVMSWYIGRDPGATWIGPQPADGASLGWQWQGGHMEFGLDVDRGWYDDRFGGDMFHGSQDFDDIANQMVGIGGTANPSLSYFGDVRDTVHGLAGDIAAIKAAVGGADIHIAAVKAELDTVEQQIAAAQPVNLTALKTAVDALSKHLGVGTA